jgi:photosystem II stability/assembly factor-like uncharacterized protein
MLNSSCRTGRRRAAVAAGGLVAVLAGARGSSQQAPEAPDQATGYAAIEPLAERSLLLDGTSVGDLMVVVGERGHILTSRDQGVSWTQQSVPTRRALTGVFFHDENLGWAVGHDAAILRTRDGGVTWERLNYEPAEERPFLDVWFADENRGIAVGAYGFFYRTEDGGDRWTDTGLELIDEGSEGNDAEYDPYAYDYGADLHLNQVSAASPERLYIAAEAGAVYRSDDGGFSWVSLPSPYEGSFFGTLPLDADSVLLFGLRGHLFRSDDAGESWTELASGTEALLTDAVRIDEDTIIVSGLAGVILVSTDGGYTFSLVQQEDRLGRVAVVPTTDGFLVTAGESGVMRIPLTTIIGGSQ